MDVDRAACGAFRGVPDVSDDTDDGRQVLVAVHISIVDFPSQGILSRPDVVGDILTDDGNFRRGCAVIGVEQAAANERNAQRFKVSGSGDSIIGPVTATVGPTFDSEAAVASAPAEWEMT